jgi:F-type H+-transporting ATPase subunit epsilon
MILELSTPDKNLPTLEVEEVTVPTVAGETMILPGHARMVSELGEGKVSFRSRSESKSFSIQGGVVEVHDEKIVVLCDQAEIA